MSKQDFTVIFQLLEESEIRAYVVPFQSEELRDSSEIAELARFAEALREPESSSFMMG